MTYQNNIRAQFKKTFLSISFIICGIFFANAQAKEVLKVNGQVVTSEIIAVDARTYLSQNFTPEEIEKMNIEQLSNISRSIIVKKFLLNEATQDEQISQSLQEGGVLSDAINRMRIDIISQAYLDTIAQRSITEQMVADQYENFKQEMSNATEYELQAVITDSRQQAERARNEIRSGNLFSDVVQRYSIDPQSKENLGNIGKVISIQLDQNLQDELNSLRVYELSGVVPIADNFAVVRYTSKSKPKVPELSEVSENIRQELFNTARQQLINQVASQINIEPIQ